MTPFSGFLALLEPGRLVDRVTVISGLLVALLLVIDYFVMRTERRQRRTASAAIGAGPATVPGAAAPGRPPLTPAETEDLKRIAEEVARIRESMAARRSSMEEIVANLHLAADNLARSAAGVEGESGAVSES
jgi:hypothetical protein